MFKQVLQILATITKDWRILLPLLAAFFLYFILTSNGVMRPVVLPWVHQESSLVTALVADSVHSDTVNVIPALKCCCCPTSQASKIVEKTPKITPILYSQKRPKLYEKYTDDNLVLRVHLAVIRARLCSTKT